MSPQRAPRIFLLLGGLLLVVVSLPLVAFVPRLSSGGMAAVADPDVVGALLVSVETSTIAVALLVLFGVPLAYLLARRSSPWTGLVNVVVQLPLAVPPVVSGILLLIAFGPYTAIGSFLAGHGASLTEARPAIVLAQVFVACPFLVVAARSAFASVDPTLEQVASTLGKSPAQIFLHVALPLAWPGIRAAVALAWVRALGEFGATAVVAYHPHTLSVLTWVRFSGSGLDATLPVVCVQLAVGAGGLALSLVASRRFRRARRAVDELRPASGRVRLSFDGGRDAAVSKKNRRPGPSLEVEVAARAGSFDLDVCFAAQSRRLAILGPSGSGKSLLLKSLAGLSRPARGRIRVSGRPLFDADEHIFIDARERRVGWVPQGFGLFPHMTVAENVLFPVGNDPADERRARDLLDAFGLGRHADRFAENLSFGEQQRAALARALMLEPDLLLLDEPFASIDAPMRLKLRRELARLLRTMDLPIVLVTHDPHEAYELAEEIVVVAGGRVLQHGRREEVLKRPASAQVAELVGMRNVFSGTVLSSDAEGTLVDYQGRALAGPPSGLEVGAAVSFSVMPHEIRVVPAAEQPPAGNGVVLDATLEAVWPRGARVHLVASVEGAARRDFWEVEEREDRGVRGLVEGDRVALVIPQSALRILPCA